MERSIYDLIDFYREQGAPHDQQMLIALLKEAQISDGGILAKKTISTIASANDLKEAVLIALIRRIPSLRYEDVPHNLEICATCRKTADLRALVEEEYGLKSGSADKALGFSYRTVNCMKNCKNGPSIKWDGKLYSGATVELLRGLLSGG